MSQLELQLIPPKGGALDTLAQSGTVYLLQKETTIKGRGVSYDSNFDKRIRRKAITNKMILSLMDIAKNEGDEAFVKSCWNTWHCQNRLTMYGNQLHGEYCKNRFCTVCLAIRKAEKINLYLPELNKWPDPFFVTLTIKAVEANKLADLVDLMINSWQKLIDKLNKRYQRNKGPKPIGLKAIECNFNPEERTYNPHIHIITPCKEVAIMLRKEWRLYWKDEKIAARWCQHARRVINGTRDLMELIKYGTKIFTEPDVYNKSMDKVPRKIYVKAQYNIFKALRNHRIFGSFGFKLPPKSKKISPIIKRVNNYETYIYVPPVNNWISEETGDFLSNHQLPLELKRFLENCIDSNTS